MCPFAFEKHPRFNWDGINPSWNRRHNAVQCHPPWHHHGDKTQPWLFFSCYDIIAVTTYFNTHLLPVCWVNVRLFLKSPPSHFSTASLSRIKSSFSFCCHIHCSNISRIITVVQSINLKTHARAHTHTHFYILSAVSAHYFWQHLDVPRTALFPPAWCLSAVM